MCSRKDMLSINKLAYELIREILTNPEYYRVGVTMVLMGSESY